jgi:hypothetical protein
VQKSRRKIESDFLRNEGPRIAMVLQRQTVDSTWVSAHFSELVKKYAEMYIAVRRRQVLGASPNYERLRSNLIKKFGKVEDDMTIEFITTKRLQLLH